MIQLNTRTYGDKSNRSLLLLHGFMGASDDWEIVSEKLSKDYYIIAIDLPGHGGTRCSDVTDFSFEVTAKAIIDYLDDKGITNTSLAGYSMGGRLALYLSIYYPERFDKVIIESSSPGLKTEEEREERRLKDALLSKRIYLEPFDIFVHNWYEMELFQTINKRSEAYQTMHKRRLKSDPQELAKSLLYAGTGSQPSLWGKLVEIKADTLLLTGELDTKFNEIADKMVKMNNRFNRVNIDDAGHNVHFEKPDEYIKTIKKFLK